MALTTHRKPAAHHKKAKGSHHRHNKHYLKTYSPYLPLLLIVIIGLAINTFWLQRTTVLGVHTNLSDTALLESTNLERSRVQSDDLRINPELAAAAHAKAQDMVDNDYWSHNTPNGKAPWNFIKESGYAYDAAAENLAYGFTNAPATVTGWMNSKQHRENLLHPTFSEVGFGIATSQDYLGKGPTTVIVAMYGSPTGSGQAGTIPGAAAVAGLSDMTPFKSVSRIELMTGGKAPWSFTIVTALTFAALLLFVYRHARIWHRVFVSSESFIVHHKLLDVVIVTYGVAGYMLTRAAGYIQ